MMTARQLKCCAADRKEEVRQEQRTPEPAIPSAVLSRPDSLVAPVLTIFFATRPESSLRELEPVVQVPAREPRCQETERTRLPPLARPAATIALRRSNLCRWCAVLDPSSSPSPGADLPPRMESRGLGLSSRLFNQFILLKRTSYDPILRLR
ncbi:hypothetical protein MRX96_005743 [Rhipicephalus microplus]